MYDWVDIGGMEMKNAVGRSVQSGMGSLNLCPWELKMLICDKKRLSLHFKNGALCAQIVLLTL